MTVCVNTLLSGKARKKQSVRRLWWCWCVRLRFQWLSSMFQRCRDKCRESLFFFFVFFKHLVGLKGNSDKASYRLRQDLVCVENVIIKGRRREDFFFPSPKIITLSFLQPRDNRSIFLTVAAISTSEHHTN